MSYVYFYSSPVHAAIKGSCERGKYVLMEVNERLSAGVVVAIVLCPATAEH